MSEKSRSTWKELQREYKRMPYGSKRAAAALDALSVAEQLDITTRMEARYDLLWAYALGDDPARALPLCAEFLALLEQNPDYPSRSTAAPYAAMIAYYVATALPQIPIEQCQALVDEFHTQVKKYGTGERLFQLHACFFSTTIGDLASAKAHLDAFYRAPRDAVSDCRACEASNLVECLLDLNLREEANVALQPLLSGALTCEEQPWSVFSMLIHDALDHRDFDYAKELGKKLSKKTLSKRTDLKSVGALLHLKAYQGPEQATLLLEKGIRWSIGVWEQTLLFHFYRGAWAFCAKLNEKEPTVHLSVPKKFACWRADGVYDSGVLADWFHAQTLEIANRFDKRNGSDYYAKQIYPLASLEEFEKQAEHTRQTQQRKLLKTEDL